MFRIKKNLNHYCDTCNEKTKVFLYKLTYNGPPESINTHRPLKYERVYLPLCKVADTPFHI